VPPDTEAVNPGYEQLDINAGSTGAEVPIWVTA